MSTFRSAKPTSNKLPESKSQAPTDQDCSSQDNYILFQAFRINPTLLDNLSDFFSNNIIISKQETNQLFLKDYNNNNGTNHSISSKISKFFRKDELEIIERLKKCNNEKEALGVLEQMWREAKFCDLVIVVGQHEYLAHRVVLAYHSAKFRQQIKDECKEKFVTCMMLDLTSERGLRKLLQYIYTYKITLTLSSVSSVIECSKELGVSRLLERCKEFLTNVDIKYLILAAQIAYNQKLIEQAQQCIVKAARNYETALNVLYFNDIGASLIIRLVREIKKSNENLEEFLFLFLVKYTKANLSSTRELEYYLVEELNKETEYSLFREINYKKLSISFLCKVIRENEFLLDLEEFIEQVILAHDESFLELFTLSKKKNEHESLAKIENNYLIDSNDENQDNSITSSLSKLIEIFCLL